MAEYYVYDGETNELLGMIQNAFSVQWMPRYYESGRAEFHLQSNTENLSMIKIGSVIVNRSREEACFIDYVLYDAETNGGEIMASGSLNPLRMRINRSTATIKGFDDLLACIRDNIRGLNLQTGQSVDAKISSTETTWEPLEDMITNFCQTYHVGFKVRFDSSQIKLGKSPYILDFYIGGQNRNVKFSDELGTIMSQSLEINDSSASNFAYIAGAGEGEARKVAELDLSGGNPRRELYVDARDIDDHYESEGAEDPKPIPDAEYTQMLLDRGREALTENARIVDYSVEIDTFNGIFKYGRDYELGDLIMTESASFGIGEFMRVSGIDITDEQMEHVDVILSSEKE